MIISNWLYQRASLTPDQPALVFEGEKWTFKQLYDEALLLAEQLHFTGIESNSRVALLGRSNADTVLFIHACWLIGAEVVCLNNRLTVNELRWQIDDAEAAAVIADDQLAQTAKLQCRTYSELKRTERKSFKLEKIWREDRTLSIMYTSGTTGLPKGVRQTAGNHTASALASALNLGLTAHDSWLSMMPLFHISGLSILIRSVIYGMEMRLYEKFDAQKAADEIEAGSVTAMSVVSLTLDKITDVMEKQNKKAHPKFRTMLAGGGSVPLAYLERAYACGLPVLQTYGMTETCSQTATLAKADAVRKAGSAGKPLFFNQLSIKGAEQAGDIGEVLIKGPHVTPGYIGSQSERSAVTKDGWLETGDLGYIDEEGYLFIIDRRSDLIISGGENIYPAEIENVLLAHPAVKEAGVCGREDEKWGQCAIAFVVADTEEDELLSFCKGRLAGYKLPKEIRFVDYLPRNASNKLKRFELKKWL